MAPSSSSSYSSSLQNNGNKMKWRKKMERAQRLHRPSLDDWERDGLWKVFSTWRGTLPENYQALLLPGVPHPPSLPVVLDAMTLDADFFANTLEAKGIPCCIRNVPKAEGWEASHCWDLETLESSPEIRNRYFKCGEDDDGKSIKVKMKHFLKYLHTTKDDSPLYIFDSAFEDDRKAKKILSDYKVPHYFRNDLFGLISEARRPPYRWFLIGPERSGTTVHIDPLATAAWNTLIVGKKRWVLFPPHVPKHIAKGKHFVARHEDDEAVHYFMNILPRIKRKARDMGNAGVFKDFACYEFTQEAGETVFIPNGWWHGVLNLTHTVGITQNFCSPRNFEQVWCKTRGGRKLMAAKWVNQLDIHHPELADKARYFNKRDQYVMKYNPEVVKRRDDAKAQFKASGKQQQLKHPQAKEKYQRRGTENTAASSMAASSATSSSRAYKQHNQQQRSGMVSPNSSSSNGSRNGSSVGVDSRMMKAFNSSFDNKSFDHAVGSLKVSQRSATASPSTKAYPNTFTKVKKEPIHASPGQQLQHTSFSYDVTDALTNANRINGSEEWNGNQQGQKQDESLVNRDVKRTRRVSPS